MNFDEVIDRRGTHALKWDVLEAQYPDKDVLPLWVADMDFPVADGILEAIQERAKHPVFGYTGGEEEVKALFVKHFNEVHAHNFDVEHLLLSTGVLNSMEAAIECFSEPGDPIMINSPIYPPFFNRVTRPKRTLVDVPMKIENDQYEFDFEAMKNAPECKMLLLCNPQNPTGRNFTRAELEKLADFAERHDMVVVADEIHADFLYETPLVPFSEINEYTKSHTITCVSCTKSFNIAGLAVSAIMIHDDEMYNQMEERIHIYGAKSINIFGLTAAKAAYETGHEWQQELLAYLQANRDFGYEYIQANMPGTKVFKSDATMFLWLDMSSYGIENLQATLASEAGVYLNDGATFSKNCADYVRLNIGCPRSTLEEALKRLKNYLEKD